jgi:transcriptional regulator with XRE-family HTH domain
MTDHPVGPALRKRQLAKQLTDLRSGAGLDTTAVAKALRCDRSQISHYEAGRRLPRYTDLVVMLQLYGAADRLEVLGELLEQASERGWWDTVGLPSWLRVYAGLEADAHRVRCFSLELVPSLLQNATYAREVLTRHHSIDADLERDVAARMRRQERLGESLSVEVVLSQALLERTQHMGEVGKNQLRWLRSATGVPGVTLRVLPFAAGLHRSGSGSVTILDFPDQTAPSVGYVMYALGGHLVDDPPVVAALDELYQELCDQALGLQESASMLSEFANRVEEA